MHCDTKNEAQAEIYYESNSSRLVHIKCPIKWTLKWKNIARIKNLTLTNSTQWNNLKTSWIMIKLKESRGKELWIIVPKNPKNPNLKWDFGHSSNFTYVKNILMILSYWY